MEDKPHRPHSVYKWKFPFFNIKFSLRVTIPPSQQGNTVHGNIRREFQNAEQGLWSFSLGETEKLFCLFYNLGEQTLIFFCLQDEHIVKIAWCQMKGFSDTTICTEYFWSTPISQRLAIPLVITIIAILPPATETRMGETEEAGRQNLKKTTGKRARKKNIRTTSTCLFFFCKQEKVK